MLNKILTIVVPTYNAEKYLRDNLESFCIKEILEDIEILIVNDGSEDNSLAIAEEYANQYPETYRVFSKQNGGHGSGINCGIQHASGKYFKVVDADDWVDQEPFVRLIHLLKKSESDIVYSGFLWVFDKGQKDRGHFEKKAEMKEPFKNVIYETEYLFDEIADKIYIKMHNMTIKTNILRDNNIKIDENCFYVDTEYITFPIPFVTTISFLQGFVYLYRIGSAQQSVSIEKMQKNEENYDRVLETLFEFYRKLGDSIPCSIPQRGYISHIIARVVAGKFKIMLSFPASRQKKRDLIIFDERLKTEYPEIYHGNINKPIMFLRKTKFLPYALVSKLVNKKYS